MTELSQDQIRVIRAWVGEETADEVLQERYNQLNDLDGVILEELRAQLAAYLAQPSSLSVDGVSVSYGANITGLRDRINDFIKVGGTGTDDTPVGGFGVHKLVRDEVR